MQRFVSKRALPAREPNYRAVCSVVQKMQLIQPQMSRTGQLIKHIQQPFRLGIAVLDKSAFGFQIARCTLCASL